MNFGKNLFLKRLTSHERYFKNKNLRRFVYGVAAPFGRLERVLLYFLSYVIKQKMNFCLSYKLKRRIKKFLELMNKNWNTDRVQSMSQPR